MLDAVAARFVTVHRGDETEQATRRPVAEQVTARLDLVAHLHVFFGDAVSEDALRTGGLERPGCWLSALRILDLDVDPRVREEIVDFRYGAFHLGPLRHFVGVM